MSIINFNNVSFAVLKDINLSIEEGEVFAIMGRNGSGKTSFCKLINGIIPHVSGGSLTGTVTVDGINTKDSTVAALAEIAGLVLDDPDAQLFTSSVRNEAAFGPENLCVDRAEIEKRVEDALSSVGLTGLEERLPSTLSGGEKQRLIIASFLTMKNKILVLDDPLCRLDPEGAAQVMTVLNNIKQRYKMTIVIVSHESKMMSEYADRVCILNNGRIIACDTAQKILSDTKLLEDNGIQPPQEIEISSVFTPLSTNHSQLSTNSSLLPVPCPCFAVQNESPVPCSAIQIKNFSFGYNNDKMLINNINLTFNENDFTAIIGANGCGKTTLLKCITGLLKPTNGDVFINGKNTKEMTVADISKEVGFVMQNPDNQLFTDSVYKEVSFALKNLKLDKKEIELRVENALNIVGLNDRQAFPPALNRSDRTKVVIACVFCIGCKILLFDEIDVGEDYEGCIKIMEMAKQMVFNGYTILFVTHNMSLVCKYAHSLIVMEKDGTISEWKKIR